MFLEPSLQTPRLGARDEPFLSSAGDRLPGEIDAAARFQTVGDGSRDRRDRQAFDDGHFVRLEIRAMEGNGGGRFLLSRAELGTVR